MLNSKSKTTFLKLSHALILLALFSVYSCMPTATQSSMRAGNNSTGTETPTNTGYPEPTYPLTGIFLQESSARSSTQLTMPITFTDSFLIRGKVLSQYLRTIATTQKICLVTKFTYQTNQDRFLILSAKSKSYTDLVSKTTEFYLQVEPSNESASRVDCDIVNLKNTINVGASNPSHHWSIASLCSNCTSGVTSSGLKLYFPNGEQVPTITVNHLLLNLAGSSSTGGVGGGNSCTESSACKSSGYDCCLQSQCVKDGALRPGAITLPGYASAAEDVRLNPNHFLLYPQFYFVCESRPGDGGTGTEPETDPDHEAAVRLMEMTQLHNCLNKVDGEFSHCTLKFTDADQSIPGNFSASSSGYNDDVNFSSLNPNLGIGNLANNIVKVIYAGQTLYDQKASATFTDGAFLTGSANDDLTTSQGVNITAPVPTNAKDKNLYLTYKVDGTCEKVGTTLGKCTKTYIQQHSDTKSTMWHDNSKIFKLPAYADISTSSSVIVKIGGTTVPEDTATWYRATSPNRIIFNSTYPIYQNQTIEISYFVTSNVANLVRLRSEAQAQVNTMCSCASSTKCNLKPLYATDSTSLVNYECQYPTPTSAEPPANQTVYVSNKNIAHRYFDLNGVNYDEDYGSAPTQEASTGGRDFNYTNNDVLKPNNLSQYVGFNEIYGSFNKTGTYIAKPAKLVKVKKDKQYDIVVSSGSFSSCLTCGSDYYSALQKIFPQNFAGQGGGYTPDFYESRRENNMSTYRADDLLYGRACFVPATMLPWTHVTSTSPASQRQLRLAGQHFMFANGYNRDWYGFDYGSLIGSFDGVNWFSIGNMRRIKATSSKLFLAVNAYVGDLSIDSNFNVNVSESSAFSTAVPDHDTESDGAECQKAHFCSNDNDCFRQLGYDYGCQNVAGLTTNWPQFDASGSEVVGSNIKTLASIVGGTNGQAKRCVYRGRGAPCLQNLSAATGGSHFNGSTSVGTLTCSPNNSCQPLNVSKFNDRISRFANTPTAQNASSISPITDTVGLGARIITRPFEYHGTKAAPSGAVQSLTANLVNAVCVPGKDVNSALDNYDFNERRPATTIDSADKLFGVGVTSSYQRSANALKACPATDAAGNSLQLFDLDLSHESLTNFTIQQNMSSNLLDLAPLTAQNIFSSRNGSQVTTVGYQKNTCLRAPGASCFSDMECAPSSFVASKAKSVDLSSVLNAAEVKFWQEELVCGNPDFKNIAPGVLNPNFSVKKNTCCREFGKTITVYTQTDNISHQWCDTSNNVHVAGVTTNSNNYSRYSRVHTVYDKITCNRAPNATKSFALSLVAPNSTDRLTQVLAQYKTLDTLNQRTCCTNHWVRSFASENGGGHAFAKSKLQNIDKAMFRNISWQADNETTIVPAVNDEPFECNSTQYLNASCEIKNLTPAEEEKYLTWAGSLELVGIPQVAIKTNDQVYKLVNDSQGVPTDPNEPLTDADGKYILLDSFPPAVPPAAPVSVEDFKDSSGNLYYSAANYKQLNMTSASTAKNSMKKVFSENEFNCCIPSGKEVPSTTTSDQCCTGNKAVIDNVARCCLPNFTDITLYLNRYVSSEGRGLSDSAYDSATGYIKDPGQVKLIASQKNLCCSGTAMTGVAISQLSIPLENGTYKPADASSTTRRFNYRTDAVDNNTETGSVGSIFDSGVRWNNHVYCVPAGFGQ